MAKRKLGQWYKRGAWWRRIRLNRKHKDKLFRYLFKDNTCQTLFRKDEVVAVWNATVRL